MLLVKDVEFHTVEQQFKEAVFTHASTSPNQQLIASLDVARRQMELEGFGLVANAIEVAFAIRQAVAANPLERGDSRNRAGLFQGAFAPYRRSL